MCRWPCPKAPAASCQRQLDELSKLVDQASDDAEGGAGVSSRLNSLSGYVDTAVDEAGKVKVNADVNTNINGSAIHPPTRMSAATPRWT